jgi:hypothetical protein
MHIIGASGLVAYTRVRRLLEKNTMRAFFVAVVLSLVSSHALVHAEDGTEHPSALLWGDTHLHTAYSFDAFLFQNRSTDPETAYRYAMGLPVIHPFHKARVQRLRPLDFLVVSDHAELTSVPLRLAQGDSVISNTEFGRFALAKMKEGKGAEVFSMLVQAGASGESAMVDELLSEEIRLTPWTQTAEIADRYNQPGKFSALIGWEWSSLPDGANLHRIVFMDGDADQAKQFLPFSSSDSVNPEDLWSWLDETQPRVRAQFVSIPHNMNLSKGRTFELNKFDGSPMTPDYATQRARWETVAEVTQTKGDSETHPLISPNDEFANFETYEFLIGGLESDEKPDLSGNYARPALMNGLKLKQELGVNPFAFGMIGSTDSHTALSSSEESNFHGKQVTDSTPERKMIARAGRVGWDMAASGVAAVWAEENTREAIVAAFKRKEVYATTGTRIGLRVFAGTDFVEEDVHASDMVARGYARGVPMGGQLTLTDEVPRFMIHASRDAMSAGLDRIQMVKGFLNSEGEPEERIYDLAGGDGRARLKDGRFEALKNTVDLDTAEYDRTQGAAELKVVWEDPDYTAGQIAVYYVRVLEAATPRHSLLDAIALQEELPERFAKTIQERAYSSPIWVN